MPTAAEAMYPNGPSTTMGQSNMEAANQAMGLSPQERYLYQHHLDNLAKGGVKQPDGKTSTIFKMDVEVNGKTYNIPTVWDNKIVDPDEAMKRAGKVGLDKFPSYDTPDEATNRYNQMHDFMERDLANSP